MGRYCSSSATDISVPSSLIWLNHSLRSNKKLGSRRTSLRLRDGAWGATSAATLGCDDDCVDDDVDMLNRPVKFDHTRDDGDDGFGVLLSLIMILRRREKGGKGGGGGERGGRGLVGGE